MFSRVGAAAYKPGLQTTETLDNIYGHPHLAFKSIHVGGTNGKGSTSHMIAAALQAQGYKTGLYTSPHLVDFRERMRINGEMIPKSRVVEFLEDWKKRNLSPNEELRDLKPSFFELTMMMAFDWFAKEKIDYAVIEVGMGGRLDSTNIITPLLSVITNISFDHTQFLGSTLDAIAKEKAGIIKSGVPIVIGEAQEEVREVFIDTAARVDAPIYFASELDDNVKLRHESSAWEVELGNGISFSIPLAGEYQKFNIKTVICALDVLRQNGVEIEDENIKKGLENVKRLTGLRGRWEIMAQKPTIICDTGHNVAGIKENLNTLRRDYPDRNIKFVIGFVNDKDVGHIVGLFPKDADYYFCRASVPRAMNEDIVADFFRKSGISGKAFPDVTDAVAAALSDSVADDIIYVGGSTFVVADFLKDYS